MRAVVQRVTRASVEVDGEVVGSIERGALVLLGILDDDGEDEVDRLALKIANFRYFEDHEGRMNRSALDLVRAKESVGLLVVSQFTLAADGRRGRRPSFDRAARPERAEPLYQRFCKALVSAGLHVETGIFRAQMQVFLCNDGPATFVLDESAG